jgi:ubiquinone/menaquinone biosynthesis C-methylase UbiE
VGHYSIPAAVAVGERGLVYALDREQRSLEELKEKAQAAGLKNIKTVKTRGGLKLGFQSGTIDFVLVYDLLHSFKATERKRLYGELWRVLKEHGIFSAYPKHVIDDFPMGEFKNMRASEVREEIERAGFDFVKKYCANISHADGINRGCVLNFRKS